MFGKSLAMCLEGHTHPDLSRTPRARRRSSEVGCSPSCETQIYSKTINGLDEVRKGALGARMGVRIRTAENVRHSPKKKLHGKIDFATISKIDCRLMKV